VIGRPLEQGVNELEPELPAEVAHVSPSELHGRLLDDSPPLVLFVETSREFAAGHAPGARWLSRSWLELHIGSIAPDRSTAIVVTDSGGPNALLAATALLDEGYETVAALAGGMKAWRQAGLPEETGLTGVMEPPADVVPAGPERSHADMMHYLQWEETLGHKYAEPAS
jgi:rhodanese-related sulfurtransferase